MNYKRISRFTEQMLSLLVVFLLLTATTLWTGRLFGHDIGAHNEPATPTASSLTAPSAQQLQQLGLDAKAVQLTPRDSASWSVSTTNGLAKGTIISTQPYAPDVKGFAGTTPIYIYVSESGTIQQLAAADNAETADFFQRAFQSLAPQWTNKSLKQATAVQVDAVSGATFSSKAIIANVQQTLTTISAQKHQQTAAPTIGWARTLVVALVLLIGIGVSVVLRGNKWARMMVLILNVVVLGFWCGQFLSLSLLRGWISNGLDPIAYLPTLMVLAVVVVMPLCKRKHHYCSWVCPLGSLQTLASMLPLPKVHCTPQVYRLMNRIRLYTFALLMLLLWTLPWAGQVLDYEPFSAFLIQSAAPAVTILAAVIVVASCFVPNVWCKCFCPMGMTLTLAEDTLTDNKPKTPHKK